MIHGIALAITIILALIDLGISCWLAAKYHKQLPSNKQDLNPYHKYNTAITFIGLGVGLLFNIIVIAIVSHWWNHNFIIGVISFVIGIGLGLTGFFVKKGKDVTTLSYQILTALFGFGIGVFVSGVIPIIVAIFLV